MQYQSVIDSLCSRSSDESTYLIYADSRTEQTGSWTARQWVAVIGALCRSLEQHLETDEGQVVVMRSDNSPTTLALMFAFWAMGVTVVPVDFSTPPGDFKRIVREMAARNVVVLESERGQLNGGDGLRVTSLEALSLSQFELDNSAQVHFAQRNMAPARDLIRVYTSGTTGAPKIIPLTEENVLASVYGMASGFGWTRQTRTLNVLPINHVHGLLVNCLIPWFMGGSVVLSDRFSSHQFWKLAVEHSVTDISLVPAIFERIAATAPELDPPRHPVRQFFSGSAPLRPELMVAFQDRFGVPIRQHWGLSEATCVTSVAADHGGRGLSQEEMTRTAGSPIPTVAIAVMDEKADKILPEGAVGELVVQGPTVIRGYLRPSEKGLNLDRDLLHDGWLRSGDLGYWKADADGQQWFFVLGRLKDTIIRGGINLYPQRIDEVVATYPGIGKFATIAFPNRWYGEEVAVVVESGSPISDDQLLDWLESSLGHESAPKLVIRSSGVPETRTGKVMRAKLAKQCAASLDEFSEARFKRRLTS